MRNRKIITYLLTVMPEIEDSVSIDSVLAHSGVKNSGSLSSLLRYMRIAAIANIRIKWGNLIRKERVIK